MQDISVTQCKFYFPHPVGMSKKPPNQAFAERLQTIIDTSPLQGVEKKLMAKRFECSSAMVTHMTKGDRLPAMDLAIRMACALDCCVEFLLTGRGPKRPGSPDDDGIDEPPWRDLPPGARHHFAEALRAIADAGGEYAKKINTQQ
jgi:DNA-binding XRE family transcriptional regulator